MSLVMVERGGGTPLTQQIYERLRMEILTGALASGFRMASTRQLAVELGVSRNIVLNAFDQLLAEGYIEARVGAGTFVASGARFRPKDLPDLQKIPSVGFRPFSTRVIDFRSGLPDLTRFPVRTWERLSRVVLAGLTPLDLAYSQPEGRPELRAEIARYIAAYRGVRCHPDQILITGGTTQAVGIISRLLLSDERRTCILEDPVTGDIQRITSGFGGRILPVAVDSQGLRVDRLPERARPAFIYVTPSHQFPLGVTMPIQRRARLLEYARGCDTYVLEDDYDSEFRYDSPPISSIQGLDPQRVIYVGTFSKTLCPALRIGYVVFPPELVRRGREVKWFTDLHNSSMEQLILARFLSGGHFVRHVHAMKKAHRALRQALVAALEKRFGAGVEVLGSAAGLHLCARFRGVRFTQALLSRIESAGAKVYPVEEHAIRKGKWADTLILGYGMLSPASIAEGVRILASYMRHGPGTPGRTRIS
ncbi:MAG TPA: PLP-dependent aminotransferase family protein [Spirochaetia bacterium]|nr:PLP-dependent aminotransferase family protein [Spirochaetia bacterium]